MLDLYSLSETISGGFRLAVREGWTSVHVCHFEGELQILPSGHSVWVHKLFCCYSLERIVAGFSSEEWLALLKPVIFFYSELQKCPANQKPFQSLNVT